MSLGDRIAKIRKRIGKNQIDFARDMKVSQSAFKNYERSASDPPVSLLIDLCNQFDVGADWLILGRGAETPKALYETVEAVDLEVRTWVAALPVPVPPEKEAQMVSLLLRYRLETENPSPETEKFILEKVA